MKKTIIIALVLVAFISCNQQEVDTKSEGEKLMQTSREWSQAAATRDINKILSYWTDDAVVMSAGEPVLKGKERIRQMVEGSLKIQAFRSAGNRKEPKFLKAATSDIYWKIQK